MKSGPWRYLKIWRYIPNLGGEDMADLVHVSFSKMQ